MAVSIATELKELGIDAEKLITGDLTILSDMLSKYEELVGEVRQNVSATESQLAVAIKAANENEDLGKLVEEFKSGFYELLYNTLDQNPEVSVLVFEALKGDLNGLAKYERDYFINSSKLTSTVVVEMPDMEKHETASKLGEAFRKVIGLFRSFDVKDAAIIKAIGNDKEGKPLAKMSDKSDNILVTMSKLRDPNKSDENSNAGRPVTGSKYRFKWNGDELPAKVTPNDVARNFVSDRRKGYLVKWTDICDMLKDEGKSVGKDSFSIKFPTGTLEAWIPEAEVSGE